MKQNMKRILLVLCMAVCFLSLTACGSKDTAAEEPIPQMVADAMKSGAQNYLMQFDSFDDERIASELKRVEKQKNNVMISALTSWKNVKGELGKMASGSGAFLSEEVTRMGDDGYRIVARVSFEKKEMDFTLAVEEVMDENGGTMLQPTEIVFAPVYTTGEKLTKAGMNTLMGMGTVFAVLIFISFIISTLKGVNTWEAKMRAQKDEKDTLAAAAAPPAAQAPVAEAPASVQAAAAQVQVATPMEVAPLPTHENLADDKELVAVITAAIAATQNVPVEGLVVRSIRRKPTSKWKNA